MNPPLPIGDDGDCGDGGGGDDGGGDDGTAGGGESGGHSGDGGGNGREEGGAVRSGRRESPLGATLRRRAVAAGGIAKTKRKDPLVASVEKVAASMAAITAAITSPAPPPSFEADIRAEVAKAMEDTTKKIDELKKFIVELANKLIPRNQLSNAPYSLDTPHTTLQKY